MTAILPGLVPPPVPELRTDRLILRAYRPDDIDEAAAMWADERVVRFIGGAPKSRSEAWARMLRAIGSWALLGYGYWAVEERATGRHVGDAGFMEQQREIDPPLTGMPEAGWKFSADVWERGYASEAVAAAVAWADEALAGLDLCCIIDPENTASIRIAEKAGFNQAGEALFDGASILVFKRLAGPRF